ncbi:MAG: hypothetical protein H6878_03505 [Rhodobiaceae bacterium]|nr:hypothetical protein [Rhodobiaceae bacterium]
MEHHYLATILGGVFLLGTSALTVVALVYSILQWFGIVSSAPAAVSLGGVTMEGVSIPPAGDPSAPANANSVQRTVSRGRAA